MESINRRRERPFHIGCILSVIHKDLLYPLGRHGLYEFLAFMVDNEVFMNQVSRVSDECRPYLIKQFPQFVTPEMNKAIIELHKNLKNKGIKESEKIAEEWLLQQAEKYGGHHWVNYLPPEVHKVCQPCTDCSGDVEKEKPIFLDSTIGNAFPCKDCKLLQFDDGKPIIKEGKKAFFINDEIVYKIHRWQNPCS
jgi:hypothetical protein